MVNEYWNSTRDAITNCFSGINWRNFVGGKVLTRVTGSIFAVILLGAIFHIRWENGFFVSQGGWEWDLVMLAAVLLIIVAGPGRISIAHLVKRIPRALQ